MVRTLPRYGDPIIRVHVDEQRCEGHGRCYSLAPEVFAPDDVGEGREIGDGSVPPELARQARLAVANCPERAITIEDV
jgi:ferredoxin